LHERNLVLAIGVNNLESNLFIEYCLKHSLWGRNHIHLGVSMKLTAYVLFLSLTFISQFSFASTCSTESSVIIEEERSLTIKICGGNINGMDDIHDIFVRALNLPSYYGRNFDALYDVLTDTTISNKKIKVEIINIKELEIRIGQRDLDLLLAILSEI